MHIISRKKLLEFCQQHADAFDALDNWFKTAKKVKWRYLDDVRQVYPSADAVGNFTVFNIKGNDYRLSSNCKY